MNDWKTAVEHPEPIPRPSYPQLVILDDHSAELGEVVRLRNDTFTLGRTGCDLSFSAEGLMSATHAKISIQEISQNRWEWVLEDASRNGVFIGLPEFQLQPGLEFLVGGTKVIVHGDRQTVKKSAGQTCYTAFESDQARIRSKPELEICPYLFSQKSTTIPLRAKPMQLGRGMGVDNPFEIDPFVEPVHALIKKFAPNLWRIEDEKSLNGIWLRITRAVLTQSMTFILGMLRRWHQLLLVKKQSMFVSCSDCCSFRRCLRYLIKSRTCTLTAYNDRTFLKWISQMIKHPNSPFFS